MKEAMLETTDIFALSGNNPSAMHHVRMINAATAPGTMHKRLVRERAARPKEFALTVPSLSKGVVGYALAAEGYTQDAAPFFMQA